MSGRAVIVRADAGASMGTGHIMRCLALAAAVRERAESEVLFVVSETVPGPVCARIRESGFGVSQVSAPAGSEADAAKTARTAAERHADWIVVDGYHFGPAYEDALGGGRRILAIDDEGRDRHPAELVLHPGLGAARTQYEPAHTRTTRLLLGPEYALLRPEFEAHRSTRKPRSARPEKVLVTLGGSDPRHLTPRVLRALSPLDLRGRVVLGGATASTAEAEGEARAAGFEVLHDVRDLAAHMAWADLAVCSAGVTLLELLFMGVPSAVLVVADNQRAAAAVAGERRLARVLGWYEDVAEDAIRAAVRALVEDERGRLLQIERGQQIVDGLGSARVCDALELT